MSDRSSNASYFLFGLLAGAATALLLTPAGRRTFRRVLQASLYELGSERRFHRGTDDESGAIEGGLAAARSWNPGVPASR